MLLKSQYPNPFLFSYLLPTSLPISLPYPPLSSLLSLSLSHTYYHYYEPTDSMNPHTGSDLTSGVQTTSGRVQGYIDETKKVNTFLGIPYAKAPIGPLRFKPPKPIVTPPSETIIATFYQKVSPQMPLPFDTLLSSELLPQSEDCLYLNVWTPAIDDSRRAVMFWLHPGACMSGSGSQKFWNGANLAKNDVVVVTINYRLGALGFMHLSDLCGEEWNDTGNLGLLDCIGSFLFYKFDLFKDER